MIIKNVSLDIVCGITSKMPETGRPEVAFAGKSNVGKSSLINGLMNRKSLARTSAAPGKTQTINFYNVNESIYLVDLPGYGYAKASEEIKAKWGKMIEDYLHKSKEIRCVFLLVDIRHEPSAEDKEMAMFLRQAGIPFTVVATKADKISRGARMKYLAPICRGLLVQPWQVIPFSSEDGTGREEMLSKIEQVCYAEEELDDAAGEPTPPVED